MNKPCSHDKKDDVVREPTDRRGFLRSLLRGAGLLGVGGLTGWVWGKGVQSPTVWQLDPRLCVACGRCATNCVLQESAVKCVHAYAMCGYCELCTGYFHADPHSLNEGAENQLCPTGAIKRTFVENPYYEYTIDEPRCVGCGRCVRGCNAYGNGSMFLQVRHDRCLNCNECSIAVACPARAFVRVPAAEPYLLKPFDNGGSA